MHIKNLSNSGTKNTSIVEEVVVEAKEAVVPTRHVDTSDEDVVVVRRSNSTKLSSIKVSDGSGSPMSRRKVRNSNSCRKIVKEAKVQPCMSWRRSNGWTRVSGQSKVSLFPLRSQFSS